MEKSRLQEPLLRELVLCFQGTQSRILHRLGDGGSTDARVIVEDELRGLYHGLLVTFDGGSALADKGLVQIVDEDGVKFDRNLHEICFKYWPVRLK